ncbi:MAG: hypothetical protein R3A43_04905 [Bacteroidia bacterium]
MSKNQSVWIVLFVVVLAVFGYLVSRGFKTPLWQKWMYRYEYKEGKKPYDIDFFIEMMQSSVPKDSFVRLQTNFSEIPTTKPTDLYLYVGSQYHPYPIEVHALLEHVAAGGKALIITEKLNENFDYEIPGLWTKSIKIPQTIEISDTFKYEKTTVELDELEISCSLPSYFKVNPWNFIKIDTSDFDKNQPISGMPVFYDETEFDETEEYNPDEEYYEEIVDTISDEGNDYTVEEYEEEEESFFRPKPVYKVLGKNSNGNNLVKIEYNEGAIFYCSNPAIFTNYQIDKPETYKYLNKVLGYIDYDKVYWDELRFQFLHNNGSKGRGNGGKTDPARPSVLGIILQSKALKTALYLLIFGVLFFVVMGIKRRLKTIEVVEPVRNSSIDFSKTIARLYWLKPNHKKMVEQKMKVFLAEVRNRYNIPTHILDNDFKELFRAKTGVEQKEINRLFDAYKVVQNSEKIHPDLLIQIYQSIYLIKQKWK